MKLPLITTRSVLLESKDHSASYLNESCLNFQLHYYSIHLPHKDTDFIRIKQSMQEQVVWYSS